MRIWFGSNLALEMQKLKRNIFFKLQFLRDKTINILTTNFVSILERLWLPTQLFLRDHGLNILKSSVIERSFHTGFGFSTFKHHPRFLFFFYLPLEWDLTFHLNKCDFPFFPLQRDSKWQVYLKFTQQFLRGRKCWLSTLDQKCSLQGR